MRAETTIKPDAQNTDLLLRVVTARTSRPMPESCGD